MPSAAIALALAMALTLGPAGPSEGRSEAQQLFDAGSLAYDRARYDAAARAFEAAYAALPRPEIAFSLAQAQRRQFFVDGERWRLRRASELYRLYLDRVPEGARRADAVEQLQQIQPLIDASGVEGDGSTQHPPSAATQLMVYSSAQGAEGSVDGGAFMSLPAIVTTAAGTHEVVVRAPGFQEVTTAADAVAGRLVPVPVPLDALPAYLELQVNRRARVVVDGREVATTPLASAIELGAGEHQISIRARGRVPATRTLHFERDQRRSVTVELAPTIQRRAAWAMLGTSAGLALAGAGTLGFALGAQRRARRTDRRREVTNLDLESAEQLNADIQQRNQLRGATIGLWSTAAVAGVVGLILVLTDRG